MKDRGTAAAAAKLFGERLPRAVRYAQLLADTGVVRGLIGPQETERLWDRHLLNCAVVGELVPESCRVLDVGSGAGLPGIPLALARPDLAVTLLEPMARRVAWLEEVVQEVGVPVAVRRGRAEDPLIRRELGGHDVVTARAVAPLGRLAGWVMPLLRPGGQLLALKGAGAGDEVAREAEAVREAGSGAARLVRCGVGLLDTPTTVVVLERRGTGPIGRRAGRQVRSRAAGCHEVRGE